jgi:hypothetical protein
MPSGLVLLIFAMAFLSLCLLVTYGFADGTFGVNHLAWRTRKWTRAATSLAM